MIIVTVTSLLDWNVMERTASVEKSVFAAK